MESFLFLQSWQGRHRSPVFNVSRERQLSNRDVILCQSSREISHQSTETAFARGIMWSINSPTMSGNARHKDNPAPLLFAHWTDKRFGQNERRSEIYIDCLFEICKADFSG
jgi:hypothetical protein